MDKVTRILRLYAQLAQGKKVNKANFCMEVECMERTFDRDIEDIRLYLSEFFCDQELVYDRSENVYCLTNAKRYLLELEEYLFVERVLIDSGLLMTVELRELLLHIASNTNKTKLLDTHCKNLSTLKGSIVKDGITLKLFYDMQRVIDNHKIVCFLYPDATNAISEHKVIPCQLSYMDGILMLIAVPFGQPSQVKTYDLKKIESFCVVGTADSQGNTV